MWKPDTARPHLEAEWLPRGHELSLTAGVIMLFPGPLAQVRQRRRVRGTNRKQPDLFSDIANIASPSASTVYSLKGL